MQRKFKCILVVFIAFFFRSAPAQIVNIETSRMQSDTTGWLGNAGAAISLTKNTNEIFATQADAHLQYKSKKSLYLLLGSYGFLKASGDHLIDNTFFHLRYNYKVNKLLRWEAFTQMQQNLITNIKSRFLVGTGPRFKLFSNSYFKLYAASLMMYEREVEQSDINILHSDIRNSSYISFTITPNKQLEIVSTSFFQPLINNLNDFRFLNQVSVRVKAGKRLVFKLNWNYLNDSKPAHDIPSVNYSLSTGFDYEF